MRTNYTTGTTLTLEQWMEALQNKQITHPLDISIFKILYSFPEHKASAGQVGKLLGYKGKNTSSPINSEIGRYGKRVASQYKTSYSTREDGSKRKWDIFFDGWEEKKLFIWQLKKELITALETLELVKNNQQQENLLEFLSELEEMDTNFQIYDVKKNQVDKDLMEGLKKILSVTVYERNKVAREKCIAIHTCQCAVCGFNFEKVYGKLGKGYIHVHHLNPVSKAEKEYQIDYNNDLRPVCPNCHAMLHRNKNKILTIEELQQIIESNSSTIK
jgi:5-methylcytosine-specific restriction protein A